MKDMLEALELASITGVIVNVITASQYKKEFQELDIQVRKVVSFPFSYGAILVGDAAKIAQEFNEYIRTHAVQAQLEMALKTTENFSKENNNNQVNITLTLSVHVSYQHPTSPYIIHTK